MMILPCFGFVALSAASLGWKHSASMDEGVRRPRKVTPVLSARLRANISTTVSCCPPHDIENIKFLFSKKTIPSVFAGVKNAFDNKSKS